MITKNKITRAHLEKGAVVYVRQSTMQQVRAHEEGRERQYELVERARLMGFARVDVIDDDLGRSGSGLQARPGFQKLVALVCQAAVGAVFCLEASRLARNGRDWHHLLDLCALVGVLLFDPEGSYDPRIMNDRLLLGLKGTMSEYELGLLRQRSLEARNRKAERGELRFLLPPGYVWTHEGRIEKDPDQRVVECIEQVFRVYCDLGSIRQTWMWFRSHDVSLPVMTRTPEGVKLGWRIPAYHNLLTLLRNPMYGGAYAFGRTGQRTTVNGGRARRTEGHRQAMSDWRVLIPDHHEGYISWDEFLRNQTMIADNAHMQKRAARKAGRGGRALLSGMVRCGRCGYMMHVFYASRTGAGHRYICRHRQLEEPGRTCIGVGGKRIDRAVAQQMLEAVSPVAIEAAEAAADAVRARADDAARLVERELEEARYEARLAARRYEAVDPDKRLVARELEARWEAALQRVTTLEHRLGEVRQPEPTRPALETAMLKTLAERLPEIWNAAAVDPNLKQRIARILIREVILDVDQERSESIAIVHWTGGQHTELRVHRNRGPRIVAYRPKPVEVVQKMAGRFTDREIAVTLNRVRRGAPRSEEPWSQLRVRELRERLDLPDYDAAVARSPVVTREVAAARLGISIPSVTRLIRMGILPGEQVVTHAPWQIPESALDLPEVRTEVRAIISRQPKNTAKIKDDMTLALPGIDK